MSRVRYIVDTSVFNRMDRGAVATATRPRAARGELALTSPVHFEVLFSARSFDDYRLVADRLVAFPYIDTVEADHRRSLAVQERLARAGEHRALSLVDVLVAATAERTKLTVLHYDSDFERIAEVTGQSHEWVVPRGSA